MIDYINNIFSSNLLFCLLPIFTHGILKVGASINPELELPTIHEEFLEDISYFSRFKLSNMNVSFSLF